ncbi:MAG: hypothetical protein RIT25_2943 [Planctomycetota bacterium]
MAHLFGKSLLASVVALVVGGATLAQDPFQEGVTLLRLGQKEEALAKFEEVLSSDPSDEAAIEIYRSVDGDVWVMLLSTEGGIREIAQKLLIRARLGKPERARDEAAIEALAAAACAREGSYESRRDAIRKLAESHGEFAVPALVKRLADADDAVGQVNAIYALRQIGKPAVLPLATALRSSSVQVRLNAAKALTEIGDARALPAMAWLAQSESQDAARQVGASFVQKHGGKGSASQLFAAQAKDFLGGAIAPADQSDVVWDIAGDALVARDVPAGLYSHELARAAAHLAVVCDPASMDARKLLVECNLAEAKAIEGDDALALECRLHALAAGSPAILAALDATVEGGMGTVDPGAIEGLAKAENQDAAAIQELVKSLGSTDGRISYAAATALVALGNGKDTAALPKVVDTLSMAVAEESVRLIQVIDGGADTARAAEEAAKRRGNRVWIDTTARAGIPALLRNPGLDVLVINEILSDGKTEDVIGIVRKDGRMDHVKVLVVAKNPEDAATRFGDTIQGTLPTGLTGEALHTAIVAALEGQPAKPRNERAEALAKSASEGLLALAVGNASISGALASLAAQLDRSDAVAVPAAKALALAGTVQQLGALTAALTGAGSNELKAAVAGAIGNVLGRTKDVPVATIEALTEVVRSDADASIRLAAAGALGKANLDPHAKLALLMALRAPKKAAAESSSD